LLPAQLFFFIGSVMSSRLQVRKIFIYQAFTPLIYNGGIILGAVLLHRALGIYSLAWGVLAGVIVGSALLNSIGAFRLGLNFRPAIGFRHPAFLEWLRLSLPLMIGISLVMFDRFFLSYFASTEVGGITLVLNAKDLFNAPFNVIGPAAGAASLPFFASLFQQHRRKEFSQSVGTAVTRLFAVGMFVSAWMIALSPWLMDLLKGGKFNHADTATITRLFAVLAVTLAVWAVQGIYARAFYAASDTKTPAIAGTLIVVLSAPMYWAMFRWMGLAGLTIASDIGILAQTATLALLLHKKRLVKLADVQWLELLRSLFAAVVACAATNAFADGLPQAQTHVGDLAIIFASSIAWLGVVVLTLLATRSQLPAQMLGLPPKDAPQ
jgi:putative peptidoglycan lipid II flippase